MSDEPSAGPITSGAPDRLPTDTVMVLTVIVLTSFVMMINETTLAVALPAIMEEFAVTAVTAQWLLTGVLLTMAIMMPMTGWIMDRFTTRTVFLFSVSVFLVGTVAAAISPTFAVLMTGRVLQAMGTAVILPLQMTVVMTVVPAHRRGTIMGVIAVVMAVAPALGPSFAGLIQTVSSWHTIFWVMVPLITATGLAGAWKLPDIGEVKRTPLDVLSVALAAVAFGGLVYGFSTAGLILDGGGGAVVPLAVFAAGGVALLFFVWRQIARSRAGDALLDLRPLKARNFVVAVSALFLVQAALFGVVNLLPLYLQGALFTSVLVAGLVNLPGGILETVLSPVGGALYDRFGARPLAIPGIVVMAAATFWLATVDHLTPVWMVAVIFAVFSIGLAITLTPLMTAGLSAVPAQLYGHGSAILNTLLQLAGAAGTAVLIAIFSRISLAGGGTPEAMADGASSAFLVAAWVTTLAGIISLFLAKIPKRTEPKRVQDSSG